MISSVERRRTFTDFRREGHRVRHGAVRLNHLPPERLSAGAPSPQLAFAIGRKFGNAVTRNRGRRRLRAAFVEAWQDRLDGRRPLPGGAYLLSGSTAVLSAPYPELVADIDACLERCLTTPAGRAEASA